MDKKACEMAKLNLLIIAADGQTHQLPDIDKSIQQGNSLIDDPELIGLKLSFNWEERFREVYEKAVWVREVKIEDDLTITLKIGSENPSKLEQRTSSTLVAVLRI